MFDNAEQAMDDVIGESMKRFLSVLCFLLMLCMLFSTVCFAEGENVDTLANWNIRIAVPEGTTAALKGSEYYIYAQEDGSIPYVMVRTYHYDDAVAFLDEFTEYMQGQYPDLEVTADIARKTIGDRKGFEIDYSYLVSGYQVRDRRIVFIVDGLAYMFASKEIDELDMTIGTMLEDVIANCEFLSDADAGQSGLADGYLFCLENGMPKYWLDFSGAVSDNLVLHCFFRSGDPTFYEKCFVLDLSSAEVTDGGLRIRQIQDLKGNDCSEWFKDLTLQFYLDAAVMKVERDEKTLAGGEEDNILTGTYVMRPIGVTRDEGEKQSHPRPEGEGPYEPEDLGMWARIYYFRTTGFFPPNAEVTENGDGTFTIHLYEVVDNDGVEHTATSAWYTVDANGEGKDDITEEEISLMR